jgi:hypothetical protein
LTSSSYKDGTAADWSIDVEISPRYGDVREIVKSVVDMATDWWLTNNLDENQRARFEAMKARNYSETGTATSLVEVRMPTYFNVSTDSYMPR